MKGPGGRGGRRTRDGSPRAGAVAGGAILSAPEAFKIFRAAFVLSARLRVGGEGGQLERRGRRRRGPRNRTKSTGGARGPLLRQQRRAEGAAAARGTGAADRARQRERTEPNREPGSSRKLGRSSLTSTHSVLLFRMKSARPGPARAPEAVPRRPRRQTAPPNPRSRPRKPGLNGRFGEGVGRPLREPPPRRPLHPHHGAPDSSFAPVALEPGSSPFNIQPLTIHNLPFTHPTRAPSPPPPFSPLGAPPGPYLVRSLPREPLPGARELMLPDRVSDWSAGCRPSPGPCP